MRPLLLLGALLLAVLPLRAQDAASVNWSLTEADGLSVTSETGVAVGSAATSQTAVVRDYTGTLSGDVTGPLGPYQRWWLDGAEWPVESGPDPARYIEFAVAAAPGATFQVTDVDLVMNAGGTGEMDASIFYDTDPSFSAPTPLEVDIQVSRDAVGTFSYDISETLTDGDMLYVRVYPWLGGGNASATRYLFLQDVTISGTGTGAPPAPVAGVTWPLTEADTTSAQAGENLNGDDVRGEGIQIRSYSGDLSDDSVGPLGPFQRWWIGADMNWPDEEAPNPERYIEFVASADDGFEFDVDGVSLVLNGQGTGNMEASLYYSTDPAFSDPVALAEGVAASRDTLGVLSFPVDVTVPDGSAFYFRVYPYLPGGSTSDGKYVLLQDVTISGEARMPIDVDGVFWALTESDTTAVSATGENLGGAPARGSNIEVRDYDGDLRDAGDAPGPLGLFQRWWLGDGVEWPVEDAPDADRYVEFAAGPADGFAFRVDSVSVYVHGDGTSEMMASLYYSTSADFSDPIALEENVPAGDGDFGGPTLRSYSVDADIMPGDSIYVRVYPWLGGGNPSVTRYLLLQAMTIYGEAINPATIANEGGPASARFVLHPSAPNPVRSATTLRYELAEAADVEIVLVNVLGQRVATLAAGPTPAGAHAVTVQAAGLAAGVYFVHMRADGEAQTRRFVVVR